MKPGNLSAADARRLRRYLSGAPYTFRAPPVPHAHWTALHWSRYVTFTARRVVERRAEPIPRDLATRRSIYNRREDT